MFGLRKTVKQTPKSQEYRETLEKKNVEAEKKVIAKLEPPKAKPSPNPEKSAAEYRKELNAYYDKQEEKKASSKENLYMGKAPAGEGDAIARKSDKTPLQKNLEARLAKLPPAPPPRQTTLSKFRNTTGRRTAVAGSKRRSRRRKLH
jgi:hypothetical protein